MNKNSNNSRNSIRALNNDKLQEKDEQSSSKSQQEKCSQTDFVIENNFYPVSNNNYCCNGQNSGFQTEFYFTNLDGIDGAIASEAHRLAILGNNFASASKQAPSSRLMQHAVSLLTAAIALKKNEPRFYSNRSFCYYSLGDFVRSLGDAEIALQFEPKCVEFLEQRTAALIALNRLAEANEVVSGILLLVSSDGQGELMQRAIELREEILRRKSELKTAAGQNLDESWSSWTNNWENPMYIETLNRRRSTAQSSRHEPVHFIIGAEDDDSEVEIIRTSRANSTGAKNNNNNPPALLGNNKKLFKLSPAAPTFSFATTNSSSSLSSSLIGWSLNSLLLNKNPNINQPASSNGLFTTTRRSMPSSLAMCQENYDIVMSPLFNHHVGEQNQPGKEQQIIQTTSNSSRILAVKIATSLLPLHIFVDDIFSRVYETVRSDFSFYKRVDWDHCFIRFATPQAAHLAIKIIRDALGFEAALTVHITPSKAAMMKSGDNTRCCCSNNKINNNNNAETNGAVDDCSFYRFSLKEASPLLRLDNVDGAVSTEELWQLFCNADRAWRDGSCYPAASSIVYVQFQNVKDAKKALAKYQGYILRQSEIVIRYALPR